MYATLKIYNIKLSIINPKATKYQIQQTLTPQPILMEHPNDFINGLIKISIAEYKIYGIPPSITIAQAIIESGWGKSSLAKIHNNHFGIKFYGFDRLSTEEQLLVNGFVILNTKEFKNGKYIEKSAKFCKYATRWASIRHHSIFLSKRAKGSLKGDYKAWLKQLKKSGYATSPSYSKKLKILIEQYKLYEYDI